MFIYELSSWVDKIDPYWYGRLIALKTSYIAVGFFIANLLLHPKSPTLIMVISGVGMIVAEMPNINSLKKKDSIYLGITILLCISIFVFSLTSFMKLTFIITVSSWAYLLYFALRRKPELFPIVSIVLMLATISQEGLQFGNYYDMWNTTIFIFQFSLIAFWLHKLFPFMYHKIWLSSLLRSIETIQEMYNCKQNLLNNSIRLRKHARVSLSSINLLEHQHYLHLVKTIHTDIAELHLCIYHLIGHKHNNFAHINSNLTNLYQAIKNNQPCELNPHHQQYSYTGIGENKILDMIFNWNQLCKHVNS